LPDQRVSIESVRLRNFLSFYEGVVQFDPGLTVIVGPNGSGKTSIFHALKFALGSNQRENRYAKWSDFIRHGATTAEVELVVRADGKQKKLLRKIDRDGIPRAYVDGRRVKAAELKSEALRLGFEVDNTLIFMPQERINALREMDPVEVRRLVEEGTGLAALRDRIAVQETEVSQDKRRLETAVAESKLVERELELLQQDLNRLEKKRKLESEEKTFETELKWALQDDLTVRIDNASQEIERNEKGLAALMEEARTIETQVSDEEKSAAELETKYDGYQLEIGRIDARLQEEESKLVKVQDETKKSVEEIRQLEREVASDKKQKGKLHEDLLRVSGAKEQQLESKRQLQTEMTLLEEERVKVEEQLEVFADWNTKRAEAHGRYKALQAEISGKDGLLRSMNEQLRAEEAELHSIESRWGQVWKTLEKMDEKELAKKKGFLETRMASLNEERFRETSSLAQLQKEADEVQQKINESSRRMPESVRELRAAVTEHGLDHVIGPLIELFAQDDSHAAAIEAVLTDGLAYAFLTEDKADFSLVEKLRDKLESASPVIMLSSERSPAPRIVLPEGTGIIGWLWDTVGVDEETRNRLRRAVGDFVLVSDHRTALKLAVQMSFRTVTVDGRVIVPRELSVTSHPMHEQTGIISSAPLQLRLAKTEKELEVTRKRVTEVVGELEKTAREREETLDLLSQIARSSGTWEKRKRLLDSIPVLQERVASTDDDLKELQGELGESERNLRALDASQPPERSRLIGQQSAIRAKQRKAQIDLSKTEADFSAAEKDELIKRSELKTIETQIEMLSSRLDELKSEMKGSQTETSRILQTQEVLRESREESRGAQVQVKEELSHVRSSLKAMGERLVELNLTNRDSRVRVAQARRQLTTMQGELEQLKTDLTGLTRPSRVRAVAVVREGIARVRHLLDEYQDITEEVAQTEGRLKGRLESLLSNVSQLTEELQEAEAAVKSIRTQYHSGMNETLARVETEVNSILSSVHFAAALRFELVQNDGDYGVEFRSKIKSDDFAKIGAGSGGERSLIAIGLILALQRFSPGPVYALDEIDTFLDATNTELVSMLLYDCSRRSQFIIFTPAKSTHMLKHADKRVGVVSPGGTEPSVIIESPVFAAQ